MNEELISTLSQPIGSWWILVPRARAFYVRIAASGDNYSSYFCSIISSLAHLPFVDMFFELKRINFCCHEIETFFCYFLATVVLCPTVVSLFVTSGILLRVWDPCLKLPSGFSSFPVYDAVLFSPLICDM